MNAFAQKLRLARRGAGLSQEQLASRVGVTKQMVSKYERGASLPPGAKLVQICEAVGRRPGFLMRAPEFDLAEVRFRKTSQLDSRALERIKADVAAQLEARIDLEEVLGVEQRIDFSAVSRIAINRDDEFVDQAAERLREAWGLGSDPIANASETLEREGVYVLPVAAPEGFEGMSSRVRGDRGLVVVRDNLAADPFRFRFTLFHELGHLVLNIEPGVPAAVEEKICNRFAGAMLFPLQRVREEYGGRRTDIFLSEVIDRKCRYGISIGAQLYRLHDSGVITDVMRKRLRSWLHENEARRFELGMGAFPSETCGDYTEQLLTRALAEEAITMSKAAEIKNVGLREVRALVREARGW